MKKILILGAGLWQTPFIRKAKSMGLCVYATDWDSNPEGREFADVFAPIDVRDKLSLAAMYSFSDKPLKLTIKLGIITLMVSTCFIVYKIVLNLFYGQVLIGWSSIIVSLFFCTGLIITVLGMIGLYVGRIFNETKQRPIYIIKDYINI